MQNRKYITQSKKVTPSKLKKEFEEYGPVKRVTMVYDKEGNSRGYAFIEYEHLEDFKSIL